MRVIPFPFRLNIGSDVVHLPRIYRLFSGRHRDRFVRRILCDHELRDFEQRFINAQSVQDRPTPVAPPMSSSQPQPLQSSDLQAKARWLAGRFAAKEAARKAAPYGAGSIGWKDVLVRIEDAVEASDGVEAKGSRRPEVIYLKGYKGLQQGCQRTKDGELVVGRAAKLSISHDGEYVVATVLAPADDG